MSKPLTREEALSRAEDYDQLADNEDNEVAYYRLRTKAAAWRDKAAQLRPTPISPEHRQPASEQSSEQENSQP